MDATRIHGRAAAQDTRTHERAARYDVGQPTIDPLIESAPTLTVVAPVYVFVPVKVT